MPNRKYAWVHCRVFIVTFTKQMASLSIFFNLKMNNDCDILSQAAPLYCFMNFQTTLTGNSIRCAAHIELIVKKNDMNTVSSQFTSR